MAESWKARFQREWREMDSALSELLARAGDLEDRRLLEALEALALRPQFDAFTWRWGPVIAQRNRAVFRPFILAHFSSLALDERGVWVDVFAGPARTALERWLERADAADDVELTRRLLTWRLGRARWRTRANAWRDEVVRRFSRAGSASARFVELSKVDIPGCSLDVESALALYRLDPSPARAFILAHLPWFGLLGEKRSRWQPLLAASRGSDPAFHFDLYRRVIDPRRWRDDVLELARDVRDAEALDAELERRHPGEPGEGVARVFLDLAQARGRDVTPYIIRHAPGLARRFGGWLSRELDGVGELLELAEQQGWLDLWAAVLRGAATGSQFSTHVQRILERRDLSLSEIRARLTSIAGPNREANFPGVSFAEVHPLEERTALALYAHSPDLVRGPFRPHITPGWRELHLGLIQRAIETEDAALIDYFASVLALQAGSNARWEAALGLLTRYFERLPEEVFVERATHALSAMPAYAVWRYDELLRQNSLARLLFERGTGRYLSDPRAIRDLLESPQIHVQALAFRLLGSNDPRAPARAAENRDLLQATLFRRLHSRTRLFAFAALDNALRHDEATARALVPRLRDALSLPEKKYPMEALVALLGRALGRWPALRAVGEAPRVWGGSA